MTGAPTHPPQAAPAGQDANPQAAPAGQDTTPRPVDDLSMNETPYPPPRSIQRVIEAGAASPHRYPDHMAAALVAGLARRLGVSEAEIVVGPGSAGLCQHLIQALGAIQTPGGIQALGGIQTPGGIQASGGTAPGPARPEVVHAALSFEAYPLIIANAGARAVPVPMAGFGHDLPAMAAAVTEQTRCVLLCNPNNPTGAALRRDELEEFLDRVPSSVMVVIDEAYREFVTDPDVPDGVALHRARDNVCVLRTFSKAYGLAALRVGYAVVPRRVLGAARMTGAVFFPGSLGQAAALACLGDDVRAEVAARCAELAGARSRLRDALLAAGLPVAPSEANFLWLPLGERAEPFAARCREAGIAVRAIAGHGVRVTVGTDAANARLCAVAVDG